MSADPRWLLIGPDGSERRSCHAPDKRAAEAVLVPRPREYVVSEASHALGLPKPLAPGLCGGCGVRPAVVRFGSTTGRCAVCRDAVHRERQALVRARQPIASLAPAVVAECRAELERMAAANGVTKGGRPRGPRIELGED